MNILECVLTEEEIMDTGLGMPACCGDGDIDRPHHIRAAESVSHATVFKTARKIIEWGEEDCTDTSHEYVGIDNNKRHCPECWKKLKKDLGV